jgi:hypothetical protein
VCNQDQRIVVDVLLVASGEDSYRAGGWSGLFGGLLPQPPVTAPEDSEEASLLALPGHRS